MAVIPQIEKIEIKLTNKIQNGYIWNCRFNLKNEKEIHVINIYCWIGADNRWIWQSGAVHSKEKTWDISSYDHLLYQCSAVIKKHSKHRVRLLYCTEYNYDIKEFIPQTYEKIELISIMECIGVMKND